MNTSIQDAQAALVKELGQLDSFLGTSPSRNPFTLFAKEKVETLQAGVSAAISNEQDAVTSSVPTLVS